MISAFICATSFLLIHSQNINKIKVQAYPPVSQISAASNTELFAKPDPAELLRTIPRACFSV